MNQALILNIIRAALLLICFQRSIHAGVADIGGVSPDILRRI